MNTNKIWTKLLIAGALLGLLFNSACGVMNTINSPEGEALTEQGDVMMSIIKSGDLQAIYPVMTRAGQKMLSEAISLASGIVNVEQLVEENAPKFTTWEFDRAQIYTQFGGTWGQLDGKVVYADGKTGKVQLNLVQQNGAWKLSGWTLEK